MTNLAREIGSSRHSHSHVRVRVPAELPTRHRVAQVAVIVRAGTLHCPPNVGTNGRALTVELAWRTNGK
jgi:hypothetical protein